MKIGDKVKFNPAYLAHDRHRTGVVLRIKDGMATIRITGGAVLTVRVSILEAFSEG
jgi:hypothetical protein